MRTTRRTGALVAVLTVALLLGGCSDDDDDDSSATSGSQRASGPPIELGFVNTENSPAGNFSDGRKGVEAAVEYINNELGGVGGRPLEVESCITNGTPESSIGCANTFVQKTKTAVLLGIDVGASGAMPIYAQAGMPYIGGLPISAEEYSAPTAYSFIGATPAAVVGLAAYAGQEMQAKKVAIVGTDIPQATAAVDAFIKPVLAKLGVAEVSTVYESATTADFTPAVTRANSTDPDALMVLFGGPACSGVMRAVQSVGVPTDKVLFVQDCANLGQIESGSGGGDGAVYDSPFLSPDSGDPNVVTYREKLGQYAKDAPVGVSTQTGFSTVMNLYAVVKDADPATISREGLIGLLQEARDVPGFMSHPFTCDGQQFPGLRSLCDSHIRMLRYENGEFKETNDQWISGATLLG